MSATRKAPALRRQLTFDLLLAIVLHDSKPAVDQVNTHRH
jgi:hypothetical protein